MLRSLGLTAFHSRDSANACRPPARRQTASRAPLPSSIGCCRSPAAERPALNVASSRRETSSNASRSVTTPSPSASARPPAQALGQVIRELSRSGGPLHARQAAFVGLLLGLASKQPDHLPVERFGSAGKFARPLSGHWTSRPPLERQGRSTRATTATPDRRPGL